MISKRLESQICETEYLIFIYVFSELFFYQPINVKGELGKITKMCVKTFLDCWYISWYISDQVLHAT